VRTLIIYAVLLTALRLMGKRQLGELAPSELVVAVLISDLAAHPLQDIGIPLVYGLIPAFTLLCCELLLSGFSVRSLRFHALLAGRPCLLIRDGRIDQREMRRNRFTLDELRYELRKAGVTDVSAVRYAVLETDGTVNLLLYAEHTPATAAQLHLAPEPDGYPLTILDNGRLLRGNLRQLGLDEAWLDGVLRERGVAARRDVYYLAADAEGHIQLTVRDEKRGAKR